MVNYIRSDLDFILEQIKIAEKHAAYVANPNDPNAAPLFGVGIAGQVGSVPAYTLSLGLRTVDGSYNNLLPGQETWGSADLPFPELLDPAYRNADGTLFDPDGPGPAPAMPTSPNYNPSNNPNSLVFDSSLRTISNLIVDQTLGNPAAIIKGLQVGGLVAADLANVALVQNIYAAYKPFADAEYQARVVMENAKSAANALSDGDPLTPPSAAEQAALDALATATAAHDVTVTDLEAASVVRDTALEPFGIAMDGENVQITNVSPDVGLSAPFNSWFTLFGQFFDHGLDLVNKGGSGTVFIPLQPDDPLYVEGSHTNFMVLTRATVGPGADGVMGTADDTRPVNTTTPFVDQNQTYTSHASHQVFLRQYAMGADGKPHATGNLIEGGGAQPGGMATWADVKEQAKMLGILLTDQDVGAVPLLRTDAYGNFIPNAAGFAQIITGVGTDGIPNTADDIVISGTLDAPVPLTGAIRINAAFLADIAHDAVPNGIADGDIEIGLQNPGNNPAVYDNELLDAHFIAGDGRVNENIGLTAVHHIFHSEHNRLAQHTKEVVLASKDMAFINEWLDVDLTQTQVDAIPTDPIALAAYADTLTWDGERLFQAAKFGTEMQYQHTVFEDFARKIQPNIDFFVVPDGYHADINPAIVAEFAHVVYRFGHSMLTEQIDRLDASFTNDQISLIQGFLNPIEFDSGHTIADGIAAGDIIRGMTRQVGNEIDEFVTSALRNNLLGLPLDLATINLARGRDTGVPSLNAARRDFYEASSHAPELKPYDSWVEFAGNLKNEASVINFMAAYGLHSSITGETTIEGKRDAAMLLIFGDMDIDGDGIVDLAPADRLDFLNGTGAWANVNGITTTGLDNIDLWIGGLAEKILPFGGMLGSTFNFVFEVQLEQLQDGDRFYYLQRLDGLHLLSEMENNTFAKIISLNADAGHLPSDVFSTPGLILEVDRTKQWNPGLGETAGADGILLDDPTTTNVDESADNLGNDPTGGSILTPLVIRNNPATPGADTNYLKYTGTEHVLLGGTDGEDILIGSEGDDTLYADGGNDRLEGGSGNDSYFGGDGDDIISDLFGDDIIRSGAGHDAINAGAGVDLIVGDAGQDFIILGADLLDEAFGGVGNDFVLGSKTTEQTLGGEGDDWIEVGAWTGAVGDDFDDQFQADAVKGHDVFHGDGGFDEFIGEGGDDIWFGSLGRGKFDGMSGYDWTTYADMNFPVDVDLARQILPGVPVLPANVALDTFTQVEGASGSKFADVIRGTDVTAADVPTEGFRGSALDAEGLALIDGLQQLLVGAGATSFDAEGSFVGGNILLGGDGSDLIEGRGGDDIIDGDKWLRVRIAVMSTFDANGPTGNTVLSYHDSMKTLVSQVMSGTINPGQLKIVRDIVSTGDATPDVDTAVYSDLRASYSFSANADGTLVVSHTGGTALDGTDMLRNIERLQFSDGTAINVIVGTPFSDNGLPPQGTGPLNQPALDGTAQDDLIIGLAGADVLNGNAGNDILVGGANGTAATTTTTTFADNFEQGNNNNNNGNANFASNWVEANDSGGTTSGQIRIDDGNNVLRFYGGTPANDYNGAQITRTMNLSTASTATITYSANPDGLDAGETVTVQFAANGTNFVNLQTISGDGNATNYTHTVTGPFAANAAIRFVTTAINANGEGVSIDGLAISYSTVAQVAGVDTLNGGLGDDTYSFSLGDGNDTINEAVNASSGGTADRISILAPTTGIDPVTLLPIMTMTALNANDSNTATTTGDLVINYGLAAGNSQTITVAGHFNGANAETGVERINFNGATYEGYALGAEDYLINRADPNNTTRVDLTGSLVNNFVAGENGTNDTITGGSGNDLIFGGTGNNTLNGGLGDDLLVGGTGTDTLDGGADLDTMVGLGGNDTYIVDDVGDVVVEALNAGTDTVETLLAALSIELMANVENLTYTGVDADQFVGTGNAGNNVISGGDLADTLSGLAGNDTLQGGLGADTMTGGDGSDVYFVDEVGDVVTETSALVTDIDRVESDVTFVLGANIENLDLNGANADINGTGNALNNIINGNDGINQLFGGGGNDTLAGNDGNDLLDGGEGNDILNGGDDNDTIIGGAGNDTIDVGNGFNTIVYNAAGFGADTIASFDAAGGTPATQDRIDLSGLGVTAANFAQRVFESTSGGNTIITVRENGAASAIQGTIQINGVTNANIDITDFTLAAAAPPVFGVGTAAANTITGNAAANTINGLGGNDTLSGAGGDDVINGGEGADVLNGGDGNDTLSGGTNIADGTYADTFSAVAYNNNNGTLNFAGNWTETGDNNSATNGDIFVTNNQLRFAGTIDTNDFIQRSINLTGATAPTLSFNYQGSATGETIAVEALNGGTWQSLGTLGGATSGAFVAALDPAHSAIRFRTTSGFDAAETFNIDNVTVTLGANSGVDTINGDAGDDTIIWNANAAAPSDGRDIVNGGTENALGDTFTINGNASAETYRIYTRLAATAAGIASAATAEIVITRAVGAGPAVVIAELAEIEEIRVNGADPSGATGAAGGDNFEIIGDFSGTSLRLNTITIDGDAGDDNIDITSLSSAHRIVFKSNGGNDTIIGTLRPQDVVELPSGATIADYEVTIEDGVTTMTSGEHTIKFTAPDGMPQIGNDPIDDEDEDDEEETELPGGNDDEEDEDEDDDSDDHHNGGGGSCDDDDDDAPAPGSDSSGTGAPVIGTANADVLLGTINGENIIALGGNDTVVGGGGADVIRGDEGDDFISAEGGDDIAFGGAGSDDILGGAGNDMLYGDAGSDRIFGDAGNDLIDAGSGNDTAHGGEGNDMFVAASGDGDDTYYGDAGSDTLDMAAITANLTVDLGTGFAGRGSASSSQSGNDTLWNVENVVTGSGNDTITASSAVNVIDGGAGNDTFRFLSAGDADGDTIAGFQPGDKIDLGGIDANGGAAGNQSFTLVAGSTLSGAAQLVVTHETREDGEYTIVQGSVDGDSGAELRLSIKGNHDLTNSDFHL
ncbi:Ca2+-binding protein, RTX toxin-related [Phyllobacterium sp. CL33Tsu]|uniref:peroxidase family protein n=1 Tax=Phyllobacterium sp. CL33Tsu TaxID=1798191 RepID=UPI0008E64620|nr:peroxidase family protein [Phyllobacterium sp. CL33Tsu]SFJ28160.1 Ca2+-binding protein, RTX toxin-related [Phyllobacterium sp. CL33Tsu]